MGECLHIIDEGENGGVFCGCFRGTASVNPVIKLQN